MEVALAVSDMKMVHKIYALQLSVGADGSHEEVDRIEAPLRRQMHTVEAGVAISIYQKAVRYSKLDDAMPVVLYT